MSCLPTSLGRTRVLTSCSLSYVHRLTPRNRRFATRPIYTVFFFSSFSYSFWSLTLPSVFSFFTAFTSSLKIVYRPTHDSLPHYLQKLAREIDLAPPKRCQFSISAAVLKVHLYYHQNLLTGLLLIFISIFLGRPSYLWQGHLAGCWVLLDLDAFIPRDFDCNAFQLYAQACYLTIARLTYFVAPLRRNLEQHGLQHLLCYFSSKPFLLLRNISSLLRYFE